MSVIHIKGEIHSSKNSRRIFPTKSKKRPFVLAKSESAKADESKMLEQLIEQRAAWEEMTRGKEYPLVVMFHFLRATKRKWDFANLVQGVSDAMTKAGYIPDDDVEHFIPQFAGWVISKNDPGVAFWILEQ